jgi:hypothetical protein
LSPFPIKPHFVFPLDGNIADEKHIIERELRFYFEIVDFFKKQCFEIFLSLKYSFPKYKYFGHLNFRTNLFFFFSLSSSTLPSNSK